MLHGNRTTADFFIDQIRDVQHFRYLHNVDSVEVLIGPDAMIFGCGGSGELSNRVTKQVNGVAVRDLTLQAGSRGQFRPTLGIGQAIGPSMSFRLAGLYVDPSAIVKR